MHPDKASRGASPLDTVIFLSKQCMHSEAPLHTQSESESESGSAFRNRASLARISGISVMAAYKANAAHEDSDSSWAEEDSDARVHSPVARMLEAASATKQDTHAALAQGMRAHVEPRTGEHGVSSAGQADGHRDGLSRVCTQCACDEDAGGSLGSRGETDRHRDWQVLSGDDGAIWGRADIQRLQTEIEVVKRERDAGEGVVLVMAARGCV